MVIVGITGVNNIGLSFVLFMVSVAMVYHYAMVRIGMCDDNEAELEGLKGLVASYARARGLQFSIDSFQSGEDLLMATGRGAVFDILFLDVYMGLTNGVEIAREIRKSDAECRIIFATNSREHAIDGYGVHAIQYLLKPLTAENVLPALDQAMTSLARTEERYIQLNNKSGYYKFAPSEIIYAESDARIVIIHSLERNPLSFYMRLDELENLLADERFLRCHKSFLVNLDYVYAVQGHSLLLETGQEIRFSLGAQEIKSLFAAYVARRI